MVRLMAKMLVLIAVLLMPLGMTAAPAAAAHHSLSASMPMRHCPERSPKHDMKGGFAECTMACSAALPVLDRPRDRPLLITSGPSESAAARILHGLHPDTATPPPKAS